MKVLIFLVYLKYVFECKDIMFCLPPKNTSHEGGNFSCLHKKRASLNQLAYAMKVMIISDISNVPWKKKTKNFCWEVNIFFFMIHK